MVALSGGKDSWTLLHILQTLRNKAPVHFELFLFTVDPGFPGFHTEDIEGYLRENNNDKIRFLEQDWQD